MFHRIAPLTAAILTVHFFIPSLCSATSVDIVNCIDAKKSFYTFDGNDKACTSEVDETSISKEETGSLECSDAKPYCKVALDYVGGQWAYYKCPDLNFQKVEEGSKLFVCSEKTLENGFIAIDNSVIVKEGDEKQTCASVCGQ